MNSHESCMGEKYQTKEKKESCTVFLNLDLLRATFLFIFCLFEDLKENV